MRKLAVIHDNFPNWVLALQAVESRLDIHGWCTADGAIGNEWLAQAEGLFTWQVSASLIRNMPALQWIQVAGAGLDHIINNPYLPDNIKITRADGQFGLWMSRYVAAHLLYETQHIKECQAAQRECRWTNNLIPEDLTGKLALVFGFGRIGQHIGHVLRALGMEVYGFTRVIREDPDFVLHDSKELARWLPSARVLVLCAPLTSLTRNFVDLNLLSYGNDQLILINIGRGELVNNNDLLAAIRCGKICKAILDVFPKEPLDSSSPLWHNPHVSITPHHSGPSTPDAIIQDIMPNLRRFAERQPITNIVDRSIGY